MKCETVKILLTPGPTRACVLICVGSCLFQCVFLLLYLAAHHLDSPSATTYFIIGPHSRLGNDFWTEMHGLGIHEYLDLISFLGHSRALSKPT